MGWSSWSTPVGGRTEYLTYDEVQLFQQQKGSFFVEPKAKSRWCCMTLKNDQRYDESSEVIRPRNCETDSRVLELCTNPKELGFTIRESTGLHIDRLDLISC